MDRGNLYHLCALSDRGARRLGVERGKSPGPAKRTYELTDEGRPAAETAGRRRPSCTPSRTIGTFLERYKASLECRHQDARAPPGVHAELTGRPDVIDEQPLLREEVNMRVTDTTAGAQASAGTDAFRAAEDGFAGWRSPARPQAGDRRRRRHPDPAPEEATSPPNRQLLSRGERGPAVLRATPHALSFSNHISLAWRNGRPLFRGARICRTSTRRSRTLESEITGHVESELPGVEVLAVELTAPQRFTVYVNQPGGVDRALRRGRALPRGLPARVLRGRVLTGIERPLRKPEHFRRVVGHNVKLAARKAARRRAQTRIRSPWRRTATRWTSRTSRMVCGATRSTRGTRNEPKMMKLVHKLERDRGIEEQHADRCARGCAVRRVQEDAGLVRHAVVELDRVEGDFRVYSMKLPPTSRSGCSRKRANGS